MIDYNKLHDTLQDMKGSLNSHFNGYSSWHYGADIHGITKEVLENAIEALETLEPKSPIWKERIVPVFEDYEDGTGAIKKHNWSDWFCPSCGGLVGERYWIPGRNPHDQHECNYCPKCGRAIDWSEINNERLQINA